MLEDQPDLDEQVEEAWNAFAVLDKGRQYGYNGPQPIQLSEIEAYCRLNFIHDESERLELVEYIQKMDAQYLKWYSDKRAKNA
jgi:hypothetical protein